MRGTRSKKQAQSGSLHNQEQENQAPAAPAADKQPTRQQKAKQKKVDPEQEHQQPEKQQKRTPAEPTRRSSRRCSASRAAACCNIDNLPDEVLQVIGQHLAAVDYTTAKNSRLVSRTWAKNVTLAIDEARMQIHPDLDILKHKVQLIFRLQPLATHLTLFIGGRSNQTSFEECAKLLAPFRQLRHLHLDYLIPGAPRLLTSQQRPTQLKALAGLKGLQSITVTNCVVLPNHDDLNALSKLTQLTQLILRPRADQAASNPSLNTATKTPVGIAALQSLQHLEAPAQVLKYRSEQLPQPTPPLASLTNLTKLVCLGGCLDVTSITALKKTTSLQVLEVEPPINTDLDSLGLDQPNLQSVAVAVQDFGDDELENKISFCSRLGDKATKLVIRTDELCGMHIEQLQGLTALEHLQIESTGNIHDANGCLYELAPLQRLRHFSFRKTGLSPVPIPFPDSTFATLVHAWARSLTSLCLEGITSSEFMVHGASVLSHLRHLVHLESLSLLCSDKSQTMLELNAAWLPAKLQSLQLRWFITTASERPAHLTQLRRLSLERCTSKRPEHFENLLQSLPGLHTLELEDVLDLSEQHIMQIRPLTQLTSLAIVAVGNHKISNSMLGLLNTLTGLRRLKWLAGDMLDSLVDPAFLRGFPNLFVLCLTTSMFYRMTRWSALNVMDFMPYCQLETVGA